MYKKGGLGDIFSGTTAFFAIVILLIIFGLVFFGPFQLFSPTKDVVLKDTVYSDSTKLLNLLKIEFEGKTMADEIYYTHRQTEENLREFVSAYLNNLPHPKESGWELVIYKMPENQELFRTITQYGTEDKHLTQSTIIPLPDETNTLKVELFLKTEEDNLSPYV